MPEDLQTKLKTVMKELSLLTGWKIRNFIEALWCVSLNIFMSSSFTPDCWK
jgi:hypothetical protein